MEDRDYTLVLLLLTGTALVILGFLIEFYNLKKFEDCYKNNFNTKYCEKLKNNY